MPRPTLRLVSRAVVISIFVASQITPSPAQESTGTVRERPTRASQPSPGERPSARQSSARVPQTVIGQIGAAPELTDEPRRLIALHIWVLRLAGSATPPADELAAKLEEQASNLPIEIGSIRDARTLVDRLRAADLLQQVRHFRMTSLDGQSAMLQRGVDVPQVIAVQRDPRVGQTNSIQMRSVGTLIQTTTRIDSEGRIQVFLQYSSSHIEKSKDLTIFEPNDGKPVYASAILVEQFSATTRVKDGTAVLVSGNSTVGKEQWAEGQILAIVGAEIAAE